jgi:hypothetical protein
MNTLIEIQKERETAKESNRRPAVAQNVARLSARIGEGRNVINVS